MIFKLQWPLQSNYPNPGILVYNESRDRMGEVPITDEITKLFAGRLKIYVHGNMAKDGTVKIDSELKGPMPPW